MTIPVPKKYSVTVEQPADTGSAWLVRVYRKRFLWKRRVSSDWFLDPEQAKTFAEQLRVDLNGNGGIQCIARRKPGWVLHRPPR